MSPLAACPDLGLYHGLGLLAACPDLGVYYGPGCLLPALRLERPLSIAENFLDLPFTEVLQNLKGTGSPEVVNIFIILLLVLCLLCSVMSLGITCYNSVSNPYQDFFGPIAVYTWNAINGIFTFLSMILFVVNTEANQQPTKLFKGIPSGLQQLATYNSYGYSFWLLLLIIILNAATIMIVYFYQHARYSKKKEQQRPMETAPKDVILF
ncbi:clarin-3 isoform X3 [Rhinatrema bivittatum]|uniref:clarin-3 isoform X3 n=1 Tax=Rhinatrema bivittatum TaxID=194408 RepID=UPI001127EE27|nr:clarin-3 isoform X3 [Rhinatrema bivittatum]